MAKKVTLESTLLRLRKEILDDLNKEETKADRSKFKMSVLTFDYSVKSLKKQIRINIKRRTKAAARGGTQLLPVSGTKVPEGQKLDDLSKYFKIWLNEALTAGIKRSKAKKVNSRDEVIMAAEVATMGRGGKSPVEHPVVWKSSSQLWFFNPGVQDQKDSFRNTILKHARAHAESNKSSKRGNEEEHQKYLLFNMWLKSVHLGHTFGLKAYQLSKIFNRPDTGTISRAAREGKLSLNISSAESKTLGPVLTSAITKNLITSLLIDIDVDVEKDIKPKKDGVVLKKNLHMQVQGIVPEFGPSNSLTGARLKARVNTFVTKTFDRIIEKAREGASAQELVNLFSSKKVEDVILDNVRNIFLGKKPKNYKNKNSKTKRIKKQYKSKVKIQKVSLASKIEVEMSRGRESVDLTPKIPYLNRKLHDKIQQNMGKGKAKKILNYQTGNFAETTKIENFSASREKGAINARVKYERLRYNTFEVGGRLHKPGRDPKRIFARSIRQLLQEEKIITLRRVKVELSG